VNRQEVFEETYFSYSGRVKGHLYNNINDKDRVEEISQDIFSDFWVALEKFNGNAKPSTLLYKIMKCRIADYLRQKYRRSESIIPTYPEWDVEWELKDKIKNMGRIDILLALIKDEETKALLLAIKKTKKRRDL